MKCPKCGGKNIEKALNRDDYKPDSFLKFQITETQYCQDCDITFIPSCPKWLAVILFVFGISIFPLCGLFLYCAYWIPAGESGKKGEGLGIPIIGMVCLLLLYVAVTIIRYSLIIRPCCGKRKI